MVVGASVTGAAVPAVGVVVASSLPHPAENTAMARTAITRRVNFRNMVLSFVSSCRLLLWKQLATKA